MTCYNKSVIISKKKPFTREEINQLLEKYNPYIKTVIDIEKKICVAGMSRHFEGEQMLINDFDSHQSQIWGGGIDMETKDIDFNSFINIRPRDNNPKNEILNPKIRSEYQKLMEYFFKEIL